MATILPEEIHLPGLNGRDQIAWEPNEIRRLSYDISHQLNLLVDDIEAGRFGEAAKTGEFIAYIRSLKAQYPKEVVNTEANK